MADAVIYDTHARMYTVVAKIKSIETPGGGGGGGGGLEQNAEQMLGLFAEGQTLMLGMVLMILQQGQTVASAVMK